MKLSGADFEELSAALRDAFTFSRLKRMAYTRLEKNLEDITLGGDFQEVAFEFIRDAQMHNYVVQLVVAARQSNPTNPRLLAFSQRFGLSPVSPELEKKVRDLPFVDISQWRSRLGEIENQVCRIEMPDGFGTGFLVSPGVVLTNYHVMESAIRGDYPASDIVFRFDYKRLSDGTTVNSGTEFRPPSSDWLIDHSLLSSADLVDDPSVNPDPDELDYALIRVDGEPGSHAINSLTAEADAAMRGFIKVPKSEVKLKTNDPLMIVQHPEGDPLKLALDTQAITIVNANGTRVRYRTNTEPGSSGSPCFNLNWELVALHHAGDPAAKPPDLARWNQGIPIDAVVNLITKRGFGSHLGH